MSVSYKLVLNVILKSAIVYSTQGIIVLSSSSSVLYKFGSILGCRCLLGNVLNLSNSDLLIVANSIDAADSYNESV